MLAAEPVLVVDDDPTIRTIVELALTDEGYDVLTAEHGGTALELVERARPSLILLDMRMPTLDGWGFSAAYRRRPGPHAPVVVMTAAQNAAAWAADIEADAVLPKPFNLSDLLGVVGAHIASDRVDPSAVTTGPAPALLDALKAELEPPAEAAGFRLMDAMAWADLAWLAYRRAASGGMELLDVFYWPRRETIVAELWRPSSLTRARRSSGPDEGADRRAVWRHGPDRDGRDLVTDIAAVIGGWLDG